MGPDGPLLAPGGHNTAREKRPAPAQDAPPSPEAEPAAPAATPPLSSRPPATHRRPAPKTSKHQRILGYRGPRAGGPAARTREPRGTGGRPGGCRHATPAGLRARRAAPRRPRPGARRPAPGDRLPDTALLTARRVLVSSTSSSRVNGLCQAGPRKMRRRTPPLRQPASRNWDDQGGHPFPDLPGSQLDISRTPGHRRPAAPAWVLRASGHLH
jgi:hypothetical protein